MTTSHNPQPHTGATTPNSSDVIAWQVRRIPMSYGRHCPGQMTLAPRACTVAFESRLEHDVIAFLAGFSGFRFVASQPFTLQFVTDGKRRHYTPDLLAVIDPIAAVLRRLGFAHWTVVEVKPADRYATHGEEIRSRLEHVTRVTGFAAVCLTERQIKQGGQPS